MPFIKDALYSYMQIPEYFQPLIDSAPVQRLRRVRQLAGTEYVYPGATHTRFEHSLGVMHLAGKLCDNLNNFASLSGRKEVVSDQEKSAVKAAALLHDIGHGPFSHVFEKLYADQDRNHEDITNWLIESELSGVLAKMGLDVGFVSRLATGNQREKERYFLGQIVAGTIDCDSLDYLVRDSYYTGAVVGSLDVERILLMTRVLGGNLAFDLKIGVPIIEGYFLLRLNSFRQIYFHKTSRSAQIMIYCALEHARDEFDLGKLNDTRYFLKWDDWVIWTAIQDDPFIQRLKRRDMLKMVHEVVISKRLDDARIKAMEAEIADAAGVGRDAVFIDAPYFPTVPYAHATTFDPEDIPICDFDGNDVSIKKLSDLSAVFSLLKGFWGGIRVYTWTEHRDKVEAAAKRVLDRC